MECPSLLHPPRMGTPPLGPLTSQAIHVGPPPPPKDLPIPHPTLATRPCLFPSHQTPECSLHSDLPMSDSWGSRVKDRPSTQ